MVLFFNPKPETRNSKLLFMVDEEEKKEKPEIEEPEAESPAAAGPVDAMTDAAVAEEGEAAGPAAGENKEVLETGAVAEQAAKPAPSAGKRTEAKAGKDEKTKPAEKPAAQKQAAPKKTRKKKKAAPAKAEIKVPQVTALEGKQAELNPDVFEVKPNIGILHEVVRAEFAAMRRGTAAAKTRAEVRGGGKKPWRQKGTGRARAGSSRAPHWTGGGAAFGPAPRDYGFKVNRKLRGKALKMALSARAGEGVLKVVDGLPFEEPKTAAAAAVLAGLEVTYPLLVLVSETEENAALSFRNLPRVGVTDTGDLLVSDIMGARTVLVTKEAVGRLNQIGESK